MADQVSRTWNGFGTAMGMVVTLCGKPCLTTLIELSQKPIVLHVKPLAIEGSRIRRQPCDRLFASGPEKTATLLGGGFHSLLGQSLQQPGINLHQGTEWGLYRSGRARPHHHRHRPIPTTFVRLRQHCSHKTSCSLLSRNGYRQPDTLGFRASATPSSSRL